MSEIETASSRREDSFLSSRGIDQSTVIMVGAILVVAFLLLSLSGRETTSSVPAEDRDLTEAEAILVETDNDTTDIAGSFGDPTDSD